MSRSGPLFWTWRSMKRRCLKRTHKDFARYGGRGIAICDRWLGSRGFENFAADLGPRPANCSLERIDNDGNYEPANCRWATKSEQSRNRSCNVLFTFQGRTQVAQDWANEFGINKDTLRERLKNGWDLGTALQTPVRKTAQSRSRTDSARIRAHFHRRFLEAA